MIDIDEIEHEQEGIIGREEDRMLRISINVVKMNDRELRLAKRPDDQGPRCTDAKTCCNPVADRQRFTQMCLDPPGWERYSPTVAMQRFESSYTSSKHLSCTKASSSTRFGEFQRAALKG